MYSNIQVWNEDIWGNVAAVPPITGQGNVLLGNYMTPTLYDTIFTNPYLTLSDLETDPMYPLCAAMVSRDNTKDNW